MGAEFTYSVTDGFGKPVGGSGLFEDEKAALAGGSHYLQKISQFIDKLLRLLPAEAGVGD